MKKGWKKSIFVSRMSSLLTLTIVTLIGVKCNQFHRVLVYQICGGVGVFEQVKWQVSQRAGKFAANEYLLSDILLSG
ncbi:hypothetical protein L4C33_20090 [Vibrio makurazakiensis]|uniref:hypothetical protein n=1 Tax=Vibrio makurazakiensis TaxID=2910250 RepID=UPI003D11D7A9